MIRIELGDGYSTVIDDIDVPLVIGRAIRVCMIGPVPYARISLYDDGQKEKRIKLHRFLLSAPPELCVDHISGDTLDNRRSNLRLATQQQNTCNGKQRSHSLQPFKGVHLLPSGRYAARICYNKKYLHLGSHDSAVAAAVAYNEAAKDLHGEFARLNVIPESEAV